MRCQCCNKNLSDYESTLRRVDNHSFLDICLKCLEDIPIEYYGRDDLEKTSVLDEEEFIEEETNEDS